MLNKPILLLCSLLFSFYSYSLVAEIDEPELEEECLTVLSPYCVDMRASYQYDITKKELNQTYQQVLDALSHDNTDDMDFSSIKAGFIEAQKQWEVFLEQECAAWYIINQAGSGRNEFQMACYINRTQDRNTQLVEWLSQL